MKKNSQRSLIDGNGRICDWPEHDAPLSDQDRERAFWKAYRKMSRAGVSGARMIYMQKLAADRHGPATYDCLDD